MDDRYVASTTISKLAQVDPVFREVMEALYPAFDPRELWDLSKSMPDQSAVHVNSNAKRERRIAQTGLGATGVATVGGLHALYLTGKPAVQRMKAKLAGEAMHAPKHAAAEELGRAGKLFAKLPGGVKTAAAAGTAGWLGLHGAELVGDALGARAQMRAIKATTPKVKKQPRPKAVTLTKADFDPIIKARRDGIISTEKALELIDQVEKAASREVEQDPKVSKGGAGILFHPVETARAVKGTKDTLKLARYLKETRAAEGARLHHDISQAVYEGRRSVGTVAASGTAGMGYAHGKKKERRLLQPPVAVPSFAKRAEVDYEWTGEISKFDEDKRQVFGWCSLSTVDGQPVVDLQNDYIPIEEMEKSAYAYVLNSRKGGDMHARVGDAPLHTSDMIESMIVTPEKLRGMGLSEEAIAKAHTGWWVGFQVNDDDQWSKVKNKERLGFSIHGSGSRVEKVLSG